MPAAQQRGRRRRGSTRLPSSSADDGSSLVKAIQYRGVRWARGVRHVEVDDPVAGEGMVVVDVARSGINFADTDATCNDYLAESSPLIPGGEISGRTADGRRSRRCLAAAATPRRPQCRKGAAGLGFRRGDDDQAAASFSRA